MSAITIWKEKLVVKLKSWEYLYSDHSVEELAKVVNWSQSFVMIWWRLINKFEIAEAWNKKVNEIDLFINDLSDQDKNLIQQREIKMKELWKTWRDVDQVKNFLDSKKKDDN